MVKTDKPCYCLGFGNTVNYIIIWWPFTVWPKLGSASFGVRQWKVTKLWYNLQNTQNLDNNHDFSITCSESQWPRTSMGSCTFCVSAGHLPEFPDGVVTYDYREHNYLFPYIAQTCIIFRCLYKNIRSNLLSFCIVDCANCCMYITKCKIKSMFKSNRVHYFVECFLKISSSGYSSEAYNYY